jgi:hypothetical protein
VQEATNLRSGCVVRFAIKHLGVGILAVLSTACTWVSMVSRVSRIRRVRRVRKGLVGVRRRKACEQWRDTNRVYEEMRISTIARKVSRVSRVAVVARSWMTR